MKLFVTGATGFIGRRVMDHALEQGHEVVGLVRAASTAKALGWAATGSSARPSSAEFVVGDVRRPDSYREALRSCDAVVHLAASFGDFSEQFSVNVVGTEKLLDAMVDVGLKRLILVSSFSVYDYDAVPAGGVIDERSPLAANPESRDPYTRTKLAQEQLVRDRSGVDDLELTVVRPGAVFGEDHLWGGGAAMAIGPVSLVFSPRSQMKLIDVENCASAIVMSTADRAIGATLNLVDDAPPSHQELGTRMKALGHELPVRIPVPYVAASAFARSLRLINRRAFDGRAKLPAIVVPEKMDAMFKPFTYPNSEAKRVLGWQPADRIDETVRSVGV